jgi:hypothetical protein
MINKIEKTIEPHNENDHHGKYNKKQKENNIIKLQSFQSILNNEKEKANI